MEKTECIHLILKHKWYHEIEMGRKKTEFRRYTDRLRKMLQGKKYVVLHRGFTKTTMTFKIADIEYHIDEIWIRLGKRVDDVT